MPLRRFHSLLPPRRRAAALFTCALLLAGCERSRSAPPSDAAPTAAGPVPESPLARRARIGWNNAAGPAMLAQGSAREQAIVLYPFADDTIAAEQLDSASEAGALVVLFGRGGARFEARLGATPAEAADDCEVWPLTAMRPAGSAAWAVGFVGGHVTPLPLDSVDVLSVRDSMALVAEASRLASSVTASTGAAFQGLRFTAHDIRRFQVAPGVQAMVAHVSRRVNQEANPQEEQTLLVAERDSGATSGQYVLAYAERSFGREEKVVTPEALAAVRLGAVSTLVIARDNEDGVIYALLERTGPRQWRVRWMSAVTRCG